MIGNDIVDRWACQRESNWKRKGWLDKLFSPSEQALIKDYSRPEIMVWLLWSMKEAAYKIYNRNTGDTCFTPARLECDSLAIAEDTASGMVFFKSHDYYIRSIIVPDFIHSTASMKDNLALATIYINQVRSAGPNYPGGHIYFKDYRGIPYLVECCSGKVRAVSFSHHGRFEASAFFD